MNIKMNSFCEHASLLMVLTSVAVILVLEVVFYMYISVLEMTMWKGLVIGVLEILIYISSLVLILSFPVYFLLVFDSYQEKMKKLRLNKM